MFRIKIYCYFGIPLFLLLPFVEVADLYGPLPKIASSDGKLIFSAAVHKDIVFETKGVGKITLNGQDLTKAADMARNASQLINRYTSTFEGSATKIEKFERMMEGEDGILGRLTSLEASTTNSTDGTTTILGERKLQTLSRRVRMLSRRLNLLSSLLIKDECTSNPCQNGGTCIDLFNDYICRCPSQWEGTNCNVDVNECSRFVGTDLGCQNGATCINRQGSYECHCRSGWFGIHCTRRSADCNSGGAELCGHGTCVSTNTETGYTCICDQGWTTDGNQLACTRDVDECKLNHPPCSVNPLVPCINVPGSFYCGACPPGYTGNGYYCADINECEILNGGCSAAPMVQCINTLGSRMCGLCPPGYVGDGVSCVFSGGGVCSVNNGGCHPLAHCSNNPRISSTLAVCTCPSDFTGNGIGPLGCRRSSQAGNACLPNPCLNNGVCAKSLLNSYTCTCPRRYSGRNCETVIDLCTPNPCQNGGTCHNSVYLRFRCVCTNNYFGARCQIQRQTCGGRLKASEGFLKYPLDSTITSTYKHQISCAWVIETNSTKVLNITFTKFSLETSKTCQYDWLQIHDGKNSAAHNLGRFCGDKLPNNGTIITTHNFIYLWFRSDQTVAKSGFELTWNSTDPVCEQFISVSSHGSLQSPGSPGNYPVNRDCYWNLLAPEGKRILFNFFTLMIGDNPDCSRDYLEFRSSESDTPFAKFCNTSHPAPLYSHGASANVHFHSDNLDTYPGFQITYSVVEGFPGCGGMYTSASGEIRSPIDNGKYPTDTICEYKIKIPQNSGMQRIKFSFISFDLENSDNCQFDSLSIYEGSNAESPLIGKYCGKKIPAPYISNSNELFIVFKSDWASNEQGFELKYESICGMKFTDPTAIIQTPNFIGHIECIFEIEQPLGKIIRINFTEFNVSSNLGYRNIDRMYPASYVKAIDSTCAINFFEIRDGDNENSTLIGKYCTAKPPVLLSSNNYVWMKLVLFDKDVSFKLNYTTLDLGCGGILKNKLGTISSPPSNINLDNRISDQNVPCRWVLSAPSDHVVKITWLNFEINSATTICQFDYIAIYSNNTETGTGDLMGKYCGNVLPPTLMSTSNVVTLIYVINPIVINNNNFLLSYNFIHEALVCGGNYFSSVGVIKSPSYPENYPINKHCTWTITVPAGHQIMLNVTDFSIENYFACRYDYLEIHNGGTMASPLIGKYCGRKIPKLIPSHTNRLYLFFNSDMTASGHGFKIRWEATATGCGGTLNGPTGSIISPQYPEPYTHNTECIWTISTSAGSLVQIIIADIELEMHIHCLIDYVEFYDGSTLNSPKLGRYCSPTHPPYIRSTGNHMLIKFRSDVSFQGRGFNIQYSSLCNNTLTGFRGVIESPNFPEAYPQNQNCLWEIKVPNMNNINITFSHFQLEKSTAYSNDTCSFDYLEIKYEVPASPEMSDEDKQIDKYGTYCGSNVPEIVHLKSSHAFIHFVSDNLLMGIGFRLEWQLDGCGGLLTHPQGTITTPNYPKAYPIDIECHWVIQVEFGQSIEIVFGEIDTEAYKNCDYDSIKIFNGKDETYPLISTLCHQTNKTTLSSSSNFMFIKFISDSSYSGKGFIANYVSKHTKCGGKFVSNQGTIVSPNYPKNYDPKDLCYYEIEVDENHVIELDFEDLDLLKNCTNNHIKVFDGPTSAYPLLTKLCGSNKPNKTIVSTYNNLYIEMTTSNTTTTTAKGFKALFRKGCGAQISTQGSGQIQFDPNTMIHHENEFCSWTIIAKDKTQHISLLITHMSSEVSDCFEYPIQIYSGESADAPLIGSYCGGKLPPTIRSSGSALHISISEPLSFYATYTVFDSKCGGTLNGAEGSIATPDFPNSYPNNIQCEWTILVAQGNHLKVSFETFELLDSTKCNTDYLEIRTNNSSGKLLGVYCGKNRPLNLTHEGSLWLFLQTSPIQQGDSPNAKGFLATYVLESSNSLSGPSGIIETPLYPQTLKSYSTFDWTITVAVGKRIVLNFEDYYLESMSDGECFYTYLEVYDGSNTYQPSLGQYCGFEKPDPIYSTSNIIYLVLQYRFVRTGSRFRLKWLEVAKQSLKPNRSPYLPKSCGSPDPIDLSGIHTFNLTSPGYPTGYENNIKCEWTFTTSSYNHLKISFTDIDFEKTISYFNSPNRFCYLDYIEVFEGINGAPNWKSLGKLCKLNETEDVYKIKSNLMKVVFVSSRTINGTGFSSKIKEVCGGEIKETSGVIIYDNSTQPINEGECQWNITVRSGKTIEITFPMFDIAHGDKGCNNYLMLRNGIYPDSPFLGNGKYCGTDIPQMLNTTGNHLFIKYVGSVNIKGFRLAFKEKSVDCGGTIVLNQFTNSTEINSPNYPNVPSPHIECFWTISAPPGRILRVDFEDRFDLTYNKGCTSEYVELRDGGTKYSPLIDRFCNVIPSSQFSSDNMILIKFFTDVEDPKNGFKAKIQIDSCGGTIRSSVGIIKSPNFNKKDLYPTNINCTWNIIVPTNNFIKLKFVTLDLPRTVNNCSDVDHISIYEKKIYSRYSYGMFCGNTIPKEISSFSNQLTINFVTSKKSSLLAGFNLTFESSQEKCGGKLNAQFGTLQSPGYPNEVYGSHRSCMWTITVNKGRRITLQILDLDVDPTTKENGLVFFNGAHFDSWITTVKGGQKVDYIKSSDNILSVFIWMTGNSGHRGFSAIYSSSQPTICKGNFNQTSGTIIQPVVEGNSTSYFCVWERTSDPMLSQTVAITIDMITDPEAVMYCRNSQGYISVFLESVRNFIYQACKTSKHIIRSPYFNTKINAVRKVKSKVFNFTIDYKVHPCGGIIKEESGSIKSPGYPNSYSDSIECSWLIKLPAEQTVKLTFDTFDLGSDCEKSYIIVYNGQNPLAPRIGLYCKNSKPPIIKSQSNQLWIDYHYETGNGGKGFSLNYEPVIHGCGGIFHDRSRIIQSPTYPNNYPNDVECEWEVVAQDGYHIGLVFYDRFFIEQSENCVNDFVEIFDRRNDTWISLGKRCGHDFPTPFNSTANRMKILFRSNNNIAGKGFKARWQLNCGGTFQATTDKQYIISPGYPQSYFQNLDCTYNIVSPMAKSLVVVFEDFYLEKGQPDCRYDNVTIMQRALNSPAHINRKTVLCGDQLPPAFRVKGNINIRFQTDRWLQKKGFRFYYYIESCGGTIREPGVISSPTIKSGQVVDYMYNFIQCYWNIEAPEGKIITLSFDHFSMTSRDSCFLTSLDVYDSSNLSITKRLATLCGNLEDNLPVIKSTKNKMTLYLKGNVFKDNEGFIANVLFTHGPQEGCGGNFTVDQKIELQAPDLSDMDCGWFLMAPSSHTIQIQINSLNLPSDCESSKKHAVKNCTCSYLQIVDGGSLLSPMIEQLCSDANSNSLQRQLITTTRYGFVRLYMIGKRSNAFKITVSPLKSKCGELYINVTKQLQVLKSPDYPNPYSDDLKCNWLIKSSGVMDRIHLHFVEFDLSEENGTHITENSCKQDKLVIAHDDKSHYLNRGMGPNIVYGGSKLNYRSYFDRLGNQEFCGKNDVPFDYYSKTNYLYLTFKSGFAKNRGRGFKIEYQLAGCDRNLTTDEGEVLSSKMEGECYINIKVQANRTISIYFIDFMFSGNLPATKCDNSAMEFRDGPLPTSNVLSKVCGYAIPSPIFSTGNQIWVHAFKKTTSYHPTFFDFIYTSTDKGRGCGGKLYNYKGKLTSPFYPGDYRNFEPCTWEIRVPINTMVALEFQVFNIQATCTEAYVTVITYDKNDMNEHKFCKDSNPAVLYSDSRMTVKYQSSMTNIGSGWTARFNAVTDKTNISPFY